MAISDAESVVMEALWRNHPRTADAIIDEVAAAHDWSAMTVRTLLNRLLKKEAVTATREGRKYFYTPILKREDYVHEKSQGLIDHLFDGQLAPLVSHFSERQSLSAEDVKALKRLIEELPDE